MRFETKFKTGGEKCNVNRIISYSLQVPQCRVYLGNLIVAQLVNELSALMDLEASLLFTN
jgi:hypothetical protein